MSDPIHVPPRDRERRSSAVVVFDGTEATLSMDTTKDTCYWNDQAYPEGTRICEGGLVCECSYGQWVRTQDSC